MKQTILLTGATGFLGSRLLHKLCGSGSYHIIILKRSYSNTNRINDLINSSSDIEVIDIDTVKEDFWKTYFAVSSVDVIIHCATYYGRGSESSITKVLESNLMFPLSLLEEAINHGLKLFINTDSYFNKPNQTYRTLLDYSLSKKTLNIWLEYLANKVKVANLRLEHIFGENDGSSKFVESMIQKIAVKRVDSIELTYGQQKRDFIYIDDVCDAYLTILENYHKFAFRYLTFEVGTGQKCSIRKFVEKIKEISGSKTKLEFGKLPFGTSGLLNRDTSGLVTKDLTVCWNKYSDIGKVFFNTAFDFDKNDKHNKALHHYSWGKKGRLTIPPVNVFGKMCTFGKNPVPYGTDSSLFPLQINHYFTKTYEEYLMKKAKGDVYFKVNPHDEAYFYRHEMKNQNTDFKVYKYLIKLELRMENR